MALGGQISASVHLSAGTIIHCIKRCTAYSECAAYLGARVLSIYNMMCVTYLNNSRSIYMSRLIIRQEVMLIAIYSYCIYIGNARSAFVSEICRVHWEWQQQAIADFSTWPR